MTHVCFKIQLSSKDLNWAVGVKQIFQLKLSKRANWYDRFFIKINSEWFYKFTKTYFTWYQAIRSFFGAISVKTIATDYSQESPATQPIHARLGGQFDTRTVYLWCQIVRSVKLSAFTHCVKLSAVSNFPFLPIVSNCPRCKIYLVSNYCPMTIKNAQIPNATF